MANTTNRAIHTGGCTHFPGVGTSRRSTAAYANQRCSLCLVANKASRHIRLLKCMRCGFMDSADRNAARTIECARLDLMVMVYERGGRYCDRSYDRLREPSNMDRNGPPYGGISWRWCVMLHWRALALQYWNACCPLYINIRLICCIIDEHSQNLLSICVDCNCCCSRIRLCICSKPALRWMWGRSLGTGRRSTAF